LFVSGSMIFPAENAAVKRSAERKGKRLRGPRKPRFEKNARADEVT